MYQYDGTIYKFTLEHNSGLHPVSVSDQYTDLPNPTYGSEDDDDTDNDDYIEESEVSVDPGDLEAFETYYVATWSDIEDQTITSGAYDTIAQVSDPFLLNAMAVSYTHLTLPTMAVV